MSRFAVIDIPDYTQEEKKNHFLQICTAKSIKENRIAAGRDRSDRGGTG